MNVDLENLRIEERPVRRGGRFLPWLLLLLLVPAGFLAGRLAKGDSPGMLGGAVAVRTEVVRRAEAAARGDFGEGGWIEVPSYHPIVVSALVPGRVEELSVLEGSAVEKGQVVARLYDVDLRDSLRLVEAEVSAARASLDLLLAGYRKEEVGKARAETDRLAADVALAEKILARTAELVPTGAASGEDLDRDEAALEVAKARHRAAVEELSRLEAGFRKEEIEQGKAELARAEAARDLARSRLSYAEVRSPAAGVVLERHVTPGTWLSAADPRIVSLFDPGDLQVRVDVRLENAERVSVGQETAVSTEAEPGKTYRGTVIRVDPLADFKKNTVQVKIRLADPAGRLHPEMICRVRFLAPEAAAPADRGAPLVPATAIREVGGSAFVFLVRSGRALRTEVRVGAARGDRVEIEKGVREGDRVIVDPQGIEDGATVEENR